MSRSTESAESAESAASESIIAMNIVAKEHHELFFQLKASVRKFLDNRIDRCELEKTTDKLKDKSKQYKSLRISEMSLENVEQCLCLQFDRHDMEMKNVQSLESKGGSGDADQTPEKRIEIMKQTCSIYVNSRPELGAINTPGNQVKEKIK